MQMTALRGLTHSVNVGLLELSCLPGTGSQHLRGELSLELCTNRLVVGTLGYLVGLC